MIIPFSKLQGAAGIFALLSLLTSFAALVTPAWQVVYAREIQQWIQSGLWLNCQTRPAGMYTCTYTFSESDFEFYTSAELVNLRTPPFFSWQRHLLIIFLLGQLFTFMALVSLVLSFSALTRRLSNVLKIVALSISTLFHSGALIAFAMFSQMVEYRFYHVSVSGIYEKQRGYSFYIESVALVFLIVALTLAIANFINEHATTDRTTTFGIGKKKYFNKHSHQQLQPSHQIYDEEPYSFQQRVSGSSTNTSVHNIIASNYSEASFGSPYIKSTYSFQHQPDFSTQYLAHDSSSKLDSQWLSSPTAFSEDLFAMRALPKPPPPYR